MAIKRYQADADTTITNAYQDNMETRGTGSNMGGADVLETFVIYAQQSRTSVELQRILVKFPVATMSSDRSSGAIPASGSVNFYLKMYNAPHARTLPSQYELWVSSISTEWDEGVGLDLETYEDRGYANWIVARSGSSGTGSWTAAGGDYHNDAKSSFTASFDLGNEDIELDITTLVEQWINSDGNVLGSKSNYGVGIKFSPTSEQAVSSSYTKRFFSRSSEFFYKRPVIEARWDSAIKDDRGGFYISSSLAGEENINDIFLHNYIRGKLRSIPSSESLIVRIYSGSSGPSGLPLDIKNVNNNAATAVSANEISTGVYKARLQVTSSISSTESLYDVWVLGSEEVHTGSAITPKKFDKGFAYTAAPSPQYVVAPMNLKSVYSNEEVARFRFFVREKNWSPTIYSKATATQPSAVLDSGSFKIFRIRDGTEAIPYGTGSTMHTQMSHDVSGSYFDLDMAMMEPGYSYGIQIAYYNDMQSSWTEIPDIYKFRVE
tara:strand:+ start:5860 stop:7335 length:1476 start_codon:yes stop_codon:yes gene_type:complete